MPATHVVKPGEHLGAIAKRYGYENFSALWEHPDNAALKAKRKDPLQLAPGDELFVPDRVQLIFKRETESSHDFQVHLDTVLLKLRLLDFDGKPRKDAPVIVRVEAPADGGATSKAQQELLTDGDGNLTIEISKHVDRGSVEVDGVELPLAIGGLDPVETETGVAQRLNNLGYLLLDGALDPDQLRLAILDFQADNDLALTGLAADVADKLAEVYGS